jgi:hypothetical protein
MKKMVLLTVLAAVFTFTMCAQTTGSKQVEGGSPKESYMKIKITIGGKELTATMADSAAARDFGSLLPLDFTLDDYNRTEKISNLPRKVNTTGSPAGFDPSVGDICIYVPWGNICVFYKDFGYSNGLVFLGKIEGGMEALNVSGSVKAKFELVR